MNDGPMNDGPMKKAGAAPAPKILEIAPSGASQLR